MTQSTTANRRLTGAQIVLLVALGVNVGFCLGNVSAWLLPARIDLMGSISSYSLTAISMVLMFVSRWPHAQDSNPELKRQ